MHPGQRFPRQARVRAGRDFAACFAQGKRAGSRFFRGIFLARTGGSTARLGMAVSRKVDARAVERNRLRRLIREWFRQNREGLPAGDVIVSGKPEARGQPASVLFEDLDRLARRLGLKPPRPDGTMPGLRPPPPPGGEV